MNGFPIHKEKGWNKMFILNSVKLLYDAIKS